MANSSQPIVDRRRGQQLIPRFGLLGAADAVVYLLARWAAATKTASADLLMDAIGVGTLVFFIYVVVVAFRVVDLESAAHPIDRWLCRHAGWLGYLVAVPMFTWSGYMAGPLRINTWQQIRRLEVLHFLAEIGFILSLVCLLRLRRHGYAVRRDWWKAGHILFLGLYAVFVFLVPMTIVVGVLGE